MARGGRRVRAPAWGAVSAGAAKAHGKRREGDEEDPDERQRVTERAKLADERRKRTPGRMATMHRTHYSGRWHGSPEKKTKGLEVQREDDVEGELLGINGKARDGRSSATDENSG